MLAAAVVIAGFPTVLLLPERPLSQDAMALSYVGSGRFLFTNTTAKTLIAQLWYIETKDGTNWTEWGAPNH